VTNHMQSQNSSDPIVTRLRWVCTLGIKGGIRNVAQSSHSDYPASSQRQSSSTSTNGLSSTSFQHDKYRRRTDYTGGFSI